MISYQTIEHSRIPFIIRFVSSCKYWKEAEAEWEQKKMQSISWHLKRNGKFSAINSHYPAVIWIVHIANGKKCGVSKHEFYQRIHRHFFNAFRIQILQFLNRNSNILMLRQANAVRIRHVNGSRKKLLQRAKVIEKGREKSKKQAVLKRQCRIAFFFFSSYRGIASHIKNHYGNKCQSMKIDISNEKSAYSIENHE